MKKILSGGLFAMLLLVLIASVSSCKKDEEVDDRLAFIGSYSCVEACATNGNFNYNFTISESSVNDTDVIINNFGDFANAQVKAAVNGNGLTIPNQTINISGIALTVSGSGSLNNNILSITYTYSAGADADNCSVTATKQ